MKIHEITTSSQKDRKRVGRGIGSGYGKTAGRGTKGQNSRSGGGVRPGFEGGQNPLAKRLPKKRGFVPTNQTVYNTVSLTQLNKLAGKVTIETLVEAGMVRNTRKPIKVLGSGELAKKLAVHLQAATTGAREAIVKAGGTFEVAILAPIPKKASKRNQQEV